MSTKTLAESRFRYSLAPITLPDAKPGSCRGVFHSEGLDPFDTLSANTAAVRPNMMDSGTVEMVIRAYFTEVALSLARNRRVALDEVGVTLSVEVGGSFPTMDAQPGDDNPLYVKMSLDGDRWALPSGIVPQRVDESADSPRLLDVEDAVTHTLETVNGTDNFHVTGRNISVNGTGEALTLTDSSAVTHAAIVTSATRGQRIEAHLATAPAAGKATLELLTHGYLTPDGRLQALTKKVTVLADEPPPEPPTPTGPTVLSINNGEFHDGTNVVTGANMIFSDTYPAAHVRILTAMGEEVSAMIGDDDSVEPGPEQFALSISVGQEMTPGVEYSFQFVMLDEDGEPVTVTQSARWRAN